MYKKLDNLKCHFKLDFSENKATILKGEGTVIVLNLQMRKLRHREVK